MSITLHVPHNDSEHQFQSWAGIAVAAVLGTVILIRVVRHLISSHNEGPVEFALELPLPLSEDYKWDSTSLESRNKPQQQIRHGKIYPSCPADGRELGEAIIPATPRDIDIATDRAGLAQIRWAGTTFAQRRRVFRTLLQYILVHQEEIVRACCLDSGKTKIDACFGEILVTVEKLQWTIAHGERALMSSRRPTNLLMCYKKNTVMYEPLGVVAACVSWNYPFHNFISPVISALFSGNAILVKPSEQTCWSTTYFHSLIQTALAACGHSPELVQNIVCLPDIADHLTSHSGISHITFIGSREIAHKVCSSATRSLTPVTVELGGKDPALILDDTTTIQDIDNIVSILMRGVFQSAGQNCIGIERVIAMPQAHDLILQKTQPLISSLRVGSPLLTRTEIDMGSMISSRSFSRLESLIQDAVHHGAQLHTGGHRYRHPDFPHGTYFAPTLLSHVTPSMEIAQTELFAPVFLLMRATDVDNAIALANGTSYGLGASVFGHDHTSLNRCKRELRCGMVAVNDFGSYYACSLPFGGTKGSGYGRFGGDEGLRALCNVKAVCEDVWWARWLRVQTRIPTVLRYPVRAQQGWDMCKGIVEMGYGIGVGQKMGGVLKLFVALTGNKARQKKA